MKQMTVFTTIGVSSESPVINYRLRPPSVLFAFLVLLGISGSIQGQQIEKGTIHIIKNTLGGGGTFNYTSSPALGSLGTDFSILASAISGGSIVINLSPGIYSVTETDPQTDPRGWDFTTLDCDEEDSATVTSPLMPTATPIATIGLDAGETITCTFTNTKRGSITVIKTTQGGDDIFGFTGTGPSAFDFGGGFNLTTSSNTSDGFDFGGIFTNLELGAYNLAETGKSGWDLNTATCTGDDDGVNPASIVLDAGEDVVCIFDNIQRGSIEFVKTITAWSGLSAEAQPPSKEFTFNTGGGFFLDGPTGSVTQTTLEPIDEDDLTATSGQIEVIPGSGYSVAEADPTAAGWALITPVTCNDTSPASSIDVGPGENVKCTFTNQPLGSTVIRKTSVGGEGDFGFTWGNGTNTNVPEDVSSTFSVDTTGDSGTDTQVFRAKLLINEDYDLLETSVPAAAGDYTQGWTLTGVGCVDSPSNDTLVPGNNGSDTTIIADSGETVTCTFTNTLDGVLVIRNETVPDGIDLDFEFTGSVNGFIRDFSTFDGNPDDEELFVTGQPSGVPYTATENVPNGWDLSNINCVAEDGELDSLVTIGKKRVSVDTLAAGEVVICTFLNDSTIFKDGFEGD